MRDIILGIVLGAVLLLIIEIFKIVRFMIEHKDYYRKRIDSLSVPLERVSSEPLNDSNVLQDSIAQDDTITNEDEIKRDINEYFSRHLLGQDLYYAVRSADNIDDNPNWEARLAEREENVNRCIAAWDLFQEQESSEFLDAEVRKK